MIRKILEKLISRINQDIYKDPLGQAETEIKELVLSQKEIYRFIDIYLGNPDFESNYNTTFEELAKAIQTAQQRKLEEE